MARKVTTLKEEDEKLSDYELVLVFSPEVAGDVFDASIGKISQFITERGGNLSTIEQWGKKKLAYPIKHFVEGSYVLTRFTLRPKLIKEFEANLQISEEVLRHLLLQSGG